MDWGALIKEYRQRNGLTQEAFAEDFGVDRTTVSRWENGRDEPALCFRKRLQSLSFSTADFLVRGLTDHVDNLDSPATLLDADFRVLRTSPVFQRIVKYDVTSIYGQSCERYWSAEMEQIIKNIGGLDKFRRLGILRLDLTIVRQPGEGGFGATEPLASIGRTVAIGDPRNPIGYLTTLRQMDATTLTPAPPVIVTLDDLGGHSVG